MVGPVLGQTLRSSNAAIAVHINSLSERLAKAPGGPAFLWRAGRGAAPDIVEYGDLMLNLETYQAGIGGHPLDLTYMEYELLKFLAQHPGKVFTRETLLSRVWGYEYYGGARTVDVHIRRLRKAPNIDSEPDLIRTVRSAGYALDHAEE